MLKTSASSREQFNRDRDFVVTRAFRCGGADLIPGELFDKSKVTTRRLRQMFDQRKLVMLPVKGDAPLSVASFRAPMSDAVFGNNPRPAVPDVPGIQGTPFPEEEGGVIKPPLPRFRAKDKAAEAERPAATPSTLNVTKLNAQDVMPNFHGMSEDALKEYLNANGVKPRDTWPHSRLASRSLTVWQNLKTPKSVKL